LKSIFRRPEFSVKEKGDINKKRKKEIIEIKGVNVRLSLENQFRMNP